MSIATLFVALLTFSAPADAKRSKDEGTPITVRVIDPAGEPISTAVVRHDEEGVRHRVNTVTGEWSASELFMPSGEEIRFEPGMTLQLTVSASGYTTSLIEYEVRKRQNTVEIVLAEESADEEDITMPVMTFGRDHERDASTNVPVN